MTNKSDYNSRDLRLHRRYILVTCFILVFLKYGGVTLQQLNLLGATLKLDNPKAIFLGLWVILTYSVIRYYQYFRHESWNAVVSEFKQLQAKFYQKKFTDLILQFIHPDLIASNFPDNKGGLVLPPQYFDSRKTGVLKRKFERKLFIIPQNPNYSQTSIANFGNSSVEKEVVFEFNILSFWSQTLRVLFHFVFNTPFFFEFLAPFIFVIFTIYYYAYCS